MSDRIGKKNVLTMEDANGVPELYIYPQSQIVMTHLGIPALSLFCLAVGIFAIHGNEIAFGTLCLFAAAWFILLTVFGSLLCSSIAISDEGIAALKFGRARRFISWHDVIKAKKIRRWNAGSRSYEDAFYVFDGEYSAFRERMVNLRGPIVFTDKILGARTLLDKLNERAKRCRFPLVVLDQEAARERVPLQDAGAWKRTVPKVDETSVTAF